MFDPSVLLKLLSAHTPADEAEAGHLAAIVSLTRKHGADAAARTLLPPAGPGHLTASAFVVSPDGGGLLLIRHPKLHRWLQPGGHLEPDDTPGDLRSSAARELREETGIDLPPEAFALIDVDVHRIPENIKKAEPAHDHHDVRFLAIAPTSDLPKAADVQDPCDARWVPLIEIAAIGADAGMLRVLRKLTRSPGC